MVKFGWDKLKRFLAQANSWTGQQTFSNINVTGGTISGVTFAENFTSATDPAANAAVSTTIVNTYNGTVVTLTAAGNTQTLQSPTTAATIRKFMVINNDTSNNNLSVVANSVTFVLTPGEGQCFLWDGSAWGPTDLGITDIPVLTTQGGTGRATGTTAYSLVATGTTATGAQQTLANGATTEVLVGGGASALPVWTTATGSGAPVRATSPTLVTPILGTPTSGTLTNCTTATASDNDADTSLASTAFAKSQDAVLAREPDQGVAMTAAASGSSGITVADNDNIDFGTGNFTLCWKGSLPDWTPSAGIILIYKVVAGYTGYDLYIGTTGVIFADMYRADGGVRVTTPKPGFVDNTAHEITIVVTRETDSVAGSILAYIDGVYVATQAITAAAPVSISTSSAFNILSEYGTTKRFAGTIHHAYTLNRALTAAEVLDLYRNGIAEADKWGSQTPIYTSDFSAGVDGWLNWNDANTLTGNVDSIKGEDDWLKVERTVAGAGRLDIGRNLTNGVVGKLYLATARVYIPVGSTINGFRIGANSNTVVEGDVISVSNDTITTIQYYSTTGLLTTTKTLRIIPYKDGVLSVDNGSIFYVKDFTTTPVGATLALEPGGAQPAPGQWLDSSSNKLHAMQPAAGSSLTRFKKDFEYRWTNTWTASSAAQYVGGLNQAVLSADHFITDVITQATVTTDVENLELGDGSAVAKFVAAFTPSATRTKQTVAAQNDGTNLKLVYTPAAEATMTVETIIRGFIWEP